MVVKSSDTALRTTVEGLAELRGVTFGPSSWQTISQEDIDLYARVSGDYNPIHVDPEVAAAGPFGRIVAHGYLTLGRIVPLMAEVFEVTDMGSGINYGLDRLRFPAPVPVNSRIRLLGEITEVQPIPGGQQVHVTVTFEVEGSSKPACVVQQVLRYYK